jgi:phosphoribosyl-ATP pyrophosphohydrolase/phosphoribosyl-AMP cyclohydrolase
MRDPAATTLPGIDWDKQAGLVPAIVQDADSGRVLMLAYMDREALATTLATGRVSFHSRRTGKTWTKGETSGNTLALVSVDVDCDGDALLVQARPAGPTCHLARTSCFPAAPGQFLPRLDALVAERRHARPPGSYTTTLFDAGVARIAQKVGEEGVETALAAVTGSDEALLGEAADLLFHLAVLLHSRDLSLGAAVAALAARRR